jgi:hypothetical protein
LEVDGDREKDEGLHDDGIEFVVDDGVSLVLTKVLRGGMSVECHGWDTINSAIGAIATKLSAQIRRSRDLDPSCFGIHLFLYQSYPPPCIPSTRAKDAAKPRWKEKLTCASVARWALLGIANPLFKTLATAEGLV